MRRVIFFEKGSQFFSQELLYNKTKQQIRHDVPFDGRQDTLR